MNIEGTVVFVSGIQEGTSQSGKGWRKQEFAIETLGQYPKQVVFTLFNDAIDKADHALIEGAAVDVHFNPESRKHNDRYFTELKAWKVVPLGESSSNYSQADDDELPG